MRKISPSRRLRFFSEVGDIKNFTLYNQQSPTFLQERRFLSPLYCPRRLSFLTCRVRQRRRVGRNILSVARLFRLPGASLDVP